MGRKVPALVALLALSLGAQPPAPLPAKDLSFLGWSGETAVFQKEPPDRPTWIAWAPNARPLPSKKRPVEPGHSPQLRFVLDMPPGPTADLYKALAEWAEKGTESTLEFPRVPAKLQLFDASNRLLWTLSRTVSATPAENGFIYDPPRLRNAWLSPRRTTLVIELLGDNQSVFYRIPLRPPLR